MDKKAAVKAQIHITEGLMIGLMQRLEKLAPHPEKPNHKGPLFVSLNSDIKPPAEYDGMLGSIMMEQFLGQAFGEAAGQDSSATSSSFDIQTAVDVFGEYLSERDTHNNHGRGKGSFALGEHKTICNTFNTLDKTEHAWDAYFRDYEERINLEEQLIGYDNDLSYLMHQSDIASQSLTLQ